jgi:hypothetical protein
MSPGFIPASSAGLPGSTEATSAPLSRPSFATGSTLKPSVPRSTRPFASACSSTSLAIADGMAKPKPSPPSSLMPTTWPSTSTSGPPELPGRISASCWIHRV